MKGMDKEELYNLAQFLDEQINEELRKIDRNKERLNALLSNYIEATLEMEDIED